MKKPFFSIITVCFNSGHEIERSIQSLYTQTFDDYEFIVIDGKSTDDTIARIEQYKSKIKHLTSEPDRGVYDAMNKGILLANGEFIYFLNAGDEFKGSSTLQQVYEYVLSNPSADVIYSDVIIKSKGEVDRELKYENLDSRFLCNSTICHQAIFARRLTFKDNFFDLRFSVAADYAWIVRGFYKYGFRFSHLPNALTIFYLGGLSSRANGLSERDQIQKEFMPRWIYLYFKSAQLLKNFARRVLNKLIKPSGFNV